MRTIASLLLLSQSGLTAAASADTGEDTNYETLAIPFPFYNESFGFAAGYVYGRAGWPKLQSRVLSSVMAGTRGSAMLLFAGQDLRTPWLDRLFIDPFASVGYFGEIESYINGNPDFPTRTPEATARVRGQLRQGRGLRQLRPGPLPLPAAGRPWPRGGAAPLRRGRRARGRRLHRGRSAEPAAEWTELRGHATVLPLPGDRWERPLDHHQHTNGVDLGLTWDNRDFPPSPARGQSVALRVSRDFGAFDSSDSWTVLQGEVDQYFELRGLPRIRQAVLALNAWTADTPSWDERPDGSVANRPPAYAGATLGGLWRMRAYPSQRFNNRAAIYYGAELRVIPQWNPFDAWPAFQSYADVEWLQLVPFVELVRVGPEWDLDTLHSSMKWSAGLGIRAWASGFVVRVDTAVSEEGAQV